MRQFRLLSVTAVLTLLIWISADSLVNESATLRVTFEWVPANPASGMVVRSEEGIERLDVEAIGPRRIVEAAQARGKLHVRLVVQDLPTGPSVLSIDRGQVRRELAELWSGFSNLTITSVKPDAIPILADHFVQRTITLEAKKLTLGFEVEPQLQKKTATLKMRESYFAANPESQAGVLDVGPDLERLLKDQVPGKSVTLRVPLDARKFGPDAELSPPSVEATATLKAQRVTETIPTVPIFVAVSFSNFGRPLQAVNRDGAPLSLVTQTVQVTGLAEDVAKLVRGETRAYGIVQLKEDDIQALGAVKLATPEFHLPKGIELAQAPTPIEFKLVAGAEPGPRP